MIPVDTIKTRIVMQRGKVIYKGMMDCLQQVSTVYGHTCYAVRTYDHVQFIFIHSMKRVFFLDFIFFYFWK